MSNKPVQKHIVKTLRQAGEGGIRYNIQKVEVLGYDNPVQFEQDKKSFRFQIAGEIDRSMPLCIKISID